MIVSPSSANPSPFSSLNTATLSNSIAAFSANPIDVASPGSTVAGLFDVPSTRALDGLVPETVAWFTTNPASTSSWSSVYTTSNVVSSTAPGISVAMVPGTATNGSSIVISDNVTFPVFLTVNEYVIVSPACASPSPFVSLKTPTLSSERLASMGIQPCWNESKATYASSPNARESLLIVTWVIDEPTMMCSKASSCQPASESESRTEPISSAVSPTLVPPHMLRVDGRSHTRSPSCAVWTANDAKNGSP